jgi:hypothetical protein
MVIMFDSGAQGVSTMIPKSVTYHSVSADI